MNRGGRIRIGISGWRYGPWRGRFYPRSLPQKKELSYAAHLFPTIEINGTFYSLQSRESFGAWSEAVSADFVFAVKGPRFITHIRRLKDVRTPLANFLASGLLRLGCKLGPILWQLPPNLIFEPKRIEAFLKLLPHNTDKAAALARRHDRRLSGRSWLKTDALRSMRHCIEVRHKSFQVPEFVDLLREYSVALVCADSVEWPRVMDLTADFVYCRLHGSQELYASGYDDQALRKWAARVRSWAHGKEPKNAERIAKPWNSRTTARDVFLYFDNDAKVRAPADAQRLIAMVAGKDSVS